MAVITTVADRQRMSSVFRVNLSLHTYLSSVRFGRPAVPD